MIVIKQLLFLALASVGNFEKSIEVQWAYHGTSAIVANNLLGGIFTVVSNDEVLICRQGVLSFWNSNGKISETHLNHQPDKIYAYEVAEEKIIHIIITKYAGEHSPGQVAYCAYYHTYGQFFCNNDNRHTPPTSDFAAAILITDHGQVSAYVAYLNNGYLIRYDVIVDQERQHVPPQDCRSSNTTLIPVDEPKGRVIVQCDGGNAYLHDLYSGNFFVLPPEAKRVATSRFRELMLATQPAERLHQDLMVEMNMATELGNSSTLPLEGSLANSTNPVLIPDVAIVAVNETSQLEIGYFLRNGELLYFELAELERHPKIESLSLPFDTVGISGTYNSSLVVQGTFNNGSLVLVVIEAYIQQSENLSTNETDDNNELSSTILSNPLSTTTPQPSPSQTISCTQTDRYNTETSTRPHQTNKPASKNKQTDSFSESNDSYKFEIVSYILGFVSCLVLILACALPTLLLCCIKKSKEFSNA